MWTFYVVVPERLAETKRQTDRRKKILILYRSRYILSYIFGEKL